MAETPLLAVRCPQDLLNLIEKEKSLTGRSKTDIVVERLKQSIPSLPVVERNSLPEIPAIYLVFTPDNRLLYIGQTNNLKQRWMSHHRYGQFIEADVNSRVAWFAFDPDSVDSLPLFESELITALDSEYNGTPVKGQVLATFRIEESDWNAFKEWAESRGNTASSELVSFIESALGRVGKIYDVSLDKRIEQYLEKHIDRLDTDIDGKLDKLDTDIDKKIKTAIASLRNELTPLLDAQKELEALMEK